MLRIRPHRKWEDVSVPLSTSTSMLTEFADPERCPELILLRDSIRSWRFTITSEPFELLLHQDGMLRPLHGADNVAECRRIRIAVLGMAKAVVRPKSGDIGYWTFRILSGDHSQLDFKSQTRSTVFQGFFIFSATYEKFRMMPSYQEKR